VSAPSFGLRVDIHTGRSTYFVGQRQRRPNLPASETCPFCIGGLEAPEPYEVRSFVNRWPALPDDRCEVILYTPDHEATFSSLGAAGARRVVDLWAERTAVLGARQDVHYVLVFENRGATVGATIPHPHGQIYAFDAVPPRPLAELERGDVLSPIDGRLVCASLGWKAWVPEAPSYPYALTIAPDALIPDLPSLTDDGRNGLAAVLVDALERLDRLFSTPAPYMLWIHQRPFDGNRWPQARIHVDVVSPWRAPSLERYIAAGEVGSGIYFNPVDPEVAAAELRKAK
jgi:UDPglucose--hexose-1-phosphate uridylyltransferase